MGWTVPDRRGTTVVAAHLLHRCILISCAALDRIGSTSAADELLDNGRHRPRQVEGLGAQARHSRTLHGNG
jgi:hypothetical protein